MPNLDDSVESIRLSAIRQTIAKARPRSNGKFVKKESVQKTPATEPLVSVSNSIPSSEKGDPPLVNASFKVTNPITYFKKWWNKIIGNEGVEFKSSFRVHPLTALAIVFIIASGSFGLGLLVKLANRNPAIQYITSFAASPTPDPWVESAYSGKLETNSSNVFYLITNLDVVIRLEVPENVNLTKFIGKRILATGRYNKETKILYVTDAKDLEVLPNQTQQIPTVVVLE